MSKRILSKPESQDKGRRGIPQQKWPKIVQVKKETMAHKTQNALVFLENLRSVIFSEHMKTRNSVFNERKNQLVKIDTRW